MSKPSEAVATAAPSIVDLELKMDCDSAFITYDGSLGHIDVVLDVDIDGESHGLFLDLKPKKTTRLKFRKGRPKRFFIGKVKLWRKINPSACYDKADIASILANMKNSKK